MERFEYPLTYSHRDYNETKDTLWDRKAEEVQMYADTHNSKTFFCALKVINGPSKSESTLLQSADGSTLIKDQEGLRNRWAEHLNALMNRPLTIDPTALDQILRQPTLAMIWISLLQLMNLPKP